MKEVEFNEGEVEMFQISNGQPSKEYSGGGYKSNNNYQKKFKPFKPPEESVKVLYTDGGSKKFSGNENGYHWVGAWCFYDQDTDQLMGSAVDNATNNQMELTSAIEALKYLDKMGISKDKWVTIKLDSDYVRLGIIFWIKKWMKSDWKRTNREGQLEDVKNKELWQELYELSAARKVFWVHVPGHSGEEGNEKADKHCSQLIREFVESHDIH